VAKPNSGTAKRFRERNDKVERTQHTKGPAIANTAKIKALPAVVTAHDFISFLSQYKFTEEFVVIGTVNYCYFRFILRFSGIKGGLNISYSFWRRTETTSLYHH
jgi:hypothetical protein